jgi:ubiquinone/menaquinone biosynthesis C-methylase UbiE
MMPVEAINEASRKCLDMGITILQGFRLADTDAAHIVALLDYMAPAIGSSWVDIGCGFGEPARLMQEARPDLHFELVNDNEFQLGEVPGHLSAWRADMHELPFSDQTFDGAMFLYSLCHSQLIAALGEAGRVVKDGGRLFVFDYLRVQETKKLRQLTYDTLGARFWSFEEWLGCVQASDWQDCRMAFPDGTDATFRQAFGADGQALYDQIFADLIPVIITATR